VQLKKILILRPAMHISLFSNGGYLLGYTDASKVECIDWKIAFTR